MKHGMLGTDQRDQMLQLYFYCCEVNFESGTFWQNVSWLWGAALQSDGSSSSSSSPDLLLRVCKWRQLHRWSKRELGRSSCCVACAVCSWKLSSPASAFNEMNVTGPQHVESLSAIFTVTVTWKCYTSHTNCCQCVLSFIHLTEY